METKNYFFNNNNNKIPFNNDSTNQNIIPKITSGKIININNNQQELYDFYDQSEKEKEKDSITEEDLGNGKKIVDFLTKDLINKMTLISPIPQQNLPQKKTIMENLMQEKDESFEEKEEEDLSPDEEEGEESDDSNIEDLNPQNEIKIIKNENEKENIEKNKNFKLEKNKKINNDFDKNKENNINAQNLNKTFSYNIKDINNKEKLSNSHITSFFYLTTKHLKEELENEHSYYSDFNNSHNYIPKINLESNCNENNTNSNGHSNNISNTNESLQNESLNFNVSPNTFFGAYNQVSIDKNSNEKKSETDNNNKTNNLNNDDEISNNSKNESKITIRERSQKEESINSDKKINNIQPFYPKNNYNNTDENHYNQTLKIVNNNFPNNNNNIIFNINSIIQF